MTNVGIVILNYLCFNDTINCVNDFFNQDTKDINFYISIVDNASSNNSYEYLSMYFEKYNNVIVNKTDKNIGFARGNNFGYIKLLSSFNVDLDFVICSNDDIRIERKDLYSWIISCFHKTKFSVLGPDIYSLSKKYHQNPMINKSKDRKFLKKEIIKLQLLKLYLTLNVFSKRKEKYFIADSDYKKEDYTKTLNGAFLIYSKLYFEKYNDLFNPNTFLYLEEDLLKLRCDRSDLKMVYMPNFSVNHIQESSTNSINKNQRNKFIFRLKHIINSYQIYIKELE